MVEVVTELPPAVEARFRKPSRGGRPRPEAGYAHGSAGNVRAGTLVLLWLRLRERRIDDARFEVFGGPSAIACAEALCERLTGATVEQALAITGLELAEGLQLSAAERGVALVVEDALKAALQAGDSNR